MMSFLRTWGGVLPISVFTETSPRLGTQWVLKMSAERRDVTSRTEWGVNKINSIIQDLVDGQ